MRTASVFKPDMTVEAVNPEDIINNCIEDRHIANSEIAPNKMNVLTTNIVTPVVISYDVTTGSSEEKVFDATVPFKIQILEVIVEPRGASTNGTMKITDGTNDITDAMVVAVDKTMVRAATVDNAYSTIAAGGSLSIVCAGDAVASTIGLVTIIAQKLS